VRIFVSPTSLMDGTISVTFSSVTDRNGRYHVGEMRAGSYRVTTDARGYVAVDSAVTVIVEERRTTTLDFELTRGIELRGRVRCRVDGHPQEAIAIQRLGSRSPTVHADKNGSFVLQGLARSSSIRIQAPGFCSSVFKIHASAEEAEAKYISREFELKKAPLIRGKVVNEEGNPIPGARVGLTGGKLHATTDTNGRFELTVQEFGRPFVIRVRKPGYAEGASDAIRLSPKEAPK
jgi:hypothetical protein